MILTEKILEELIYSSRNSIPIDACSTIVLEELNCIESLLRNNIGQVLDNSLLLSLDLSGNRGRYYCLKTFQTLKNENKEKEAEEDNRTSGSENKEEDVN